jgi:hypothetical protein
VRLLWCLSRKVAGTISKSFFLACVIAERFYRRSLCLRPDFLMSLGPGAGSIRADGSLSGL